MEGALSVIALVAVVVSAGTVVVAAHFRKERTAELRSWAHTHGWTYTDHLPRPLGEATLPRSAVGPHPRAQHVLTGRRRQYPVVAFEQTHTMGKGTGRVRHTHRIVAVRTPGPGAELQILRRRDRGASDDTFDSTFHASGSDPAFTEAVLDGVVTKWLLADPRSRSLPVRFSGDYVLTWATMRLDPDRALTIADYLIDLVERIPAEAWKRRAPGR
ncbi:MULTISPECIES: hypothetical protein [Nocardiopsis]|uniref:Uncharacterized protein n=1 Tax=Nocardiopsis sinuspersici TaxID=501010 RepID=A0A1V3C2T9_9ACTN|nr:MULTISPECIES: hypothetical protein [Nocardiopsis]NYH51025.1 hypothetical protein [Nocardiopsis sinuspersici]OOC54826.1 hypothetical protein NOSIN_14250 [Nocardiopsis sinuspersici]